MSEILLTDDIIETVLGLVEVAEGTAKATGVSVRTAMETQLKMIQLHAKLRAARELRNMPTTGAKQ